MSDVESVSLERIGRDETGNFDGGAEITAYDARRQRLFVVNSGAGRIEVLDVSDPTEPTQAATLDAPDGDGRGHRGRRRNPLTPSRRRWVVLFPTHLVAGYLLGRWSRHPTPAVVAGAALPDLVDKPLGLLGVTDLFHSVGHAGVTVGCLGVVVLVARRVGASSAAALAGLWLGWASHLALDAVHMVVNGRPADVQFLLWPAVRHVPAVTLPPGAFAFFYVGTSAFLLELGLWAILLWTTVRPRLAARW